MSDVASAPASVPVALVYGDADACAHLRIALAEFNADIVYDSAGSDLDRTALGDSGARVAVVNLDDVLDPSLDDVYAVLEACDCRVVFNDPGSSVALVGWEHARWVRHLAAKLRDDSDVDPPRPAGAQPVNVAQAAHLSDRWLDDALDVLAAGDGVPAAAATEPELSPGVDFGAVQIPGDDIDDEAVPELALEPTDPQVSTPTVAAAPDESIAAADDPAADVTAELESESPDLDFAAVADAPAPDAPETDVGAAVDPDGDALEPQLNASFASDTDDVNAEALTPTDLPDAPELLGDLTIDDAPPAAAQRVDEPALADMGLQADALSIDWSLLDDDSDATVEPATRDAEEVAEGLDTMLDRTQRPIEDEHVDLELHVEDASTGVADLDAGTALHDELPPSSQWTLVDDTVEPPPSERSSDSDPGADNASPTRVPGQSIAESLADRDFGIELVDPIEYLAPETLPRETELYTAPELMSMADALAPQQIDENIHAEAVADPLPCVVVMAASIGGPDAVREFLSGLPADFPALFILTQHMGTEFIDLMVKQLSKVSALPVRVPVSGERAHAGEVLVVPNGAELTLSRKGAIEITSAAEAADQEPAISATMGSAAKVFGADTLAIIFSGMVADAVAGTDQVVEHGGSVWAQDSASCVVSTMVDGVTKTGKVEFSATPAQLAQHLIEQFAKESAP